MLRIGVGVIQSIFELARRVKTSAFLVEAGCLYKTVSILSFERTVVTILLTSLPADLKILKAFCNMLRWSAVHEEVLGEVCCSKILWLGVIKRIRVEVSVCL